MRVYFLFFLVACLYGTNEPNRTTRRLGTTSNCVCVPEYIAIKIAHDAAVSSIEKIEDSSKCSELEEYLRYPIHKLLADSNSLFSNILGPEWKPTANNSDICFPEYKHKNKRHLRRYL